MRRLKRPKRGEIWTGFARELQVTKVTAGRVEYFNAASFRKGSMRLRTFQLTMKPSNKKPKSWAVRLPAGFRNGQRVR